MWLDKGRKQICVVVGGRAGSSNSHKVQIPCYALDGKGFISGMSGRRGGEENAIFKLFGKNGCFSL